MPKYPIRSGHQTRTKGAIIMNPFILAASFLIGFTAGSFIVAHSYSSLQCVQAMIEDGKAHCVAYMDKDFVR